LIPLAHQLVASGHEVTIATTNVDGLLAQEWRGTIELHGNIRDESTFVLDGEPVPREREFRECLGSADLIIAVGLSAYTISLVDWIGYATEPRGTPVWWINPVTVNLDDEDIEHPPRNVVFFRVTLTEFCADPPAEARLLGLGGPAGRTRRQTGSLAE
jgi:NAD-dependent SIR2 family protein deacetylase